MGKRDDATAPAAVWLVGESGASTTELAVFRAEPACRKCAAARHDLARWEASPGRLLPAAAYVEGEPL